MAIFEICILLMQSGGRGGLAGQFWVLGVRVADITSRDLQSSDLQSIRCRRLLQTGGMAGLMGCYLVGPRLGRFDARGQPVSMPGHSPTLVVLGRQFSAN